MKTLILLLTIFLATSATALPLTPAAASDTTRNGYEIHIALLKSTARIAHLAGYRGSSTFITDSSIISNNTLSFSGSGELPAGLYLVALSDPARPEKQDYFEILLDKGDQNFSITTDPADAAGTTKVQGSKNNACYFAYLRYLAQCNRDAGLHSERLRAATAANDRQLAAQENTSLDSLETALRSYREAAIRQDPASLCALMFRSSMLPVIPAQLEQIADAEQRELQKYLYYRNHYFDAIDFGDERLTRTPFLEERINFFLDRLTVTDYDSLNAAADFILKKAEQNREVYKFCATFLLNKYANSRIACMDAVYVHVADQCFCSPDAPFGGPFWASKDDINRICENANRLRPNLCGAMAPDVLLHTGPGGSTEMRISDIHAQLTLLYFSQPANPGCDSVSGKLAARYPDYRKHGIEILEIRVYGEKEAPAGFANLTSAGGWPVALDQATGLNARRLYDISVVPRFYLLDAGRTIILKNVNEDQIDRYLNSLYP
jgi:hypothetical protein